MTEENFGRTLVVKDLEQARLLSEPKMRRYFEPFLARERSASQAAEELGCNLDTLLYHINKLRDANLLKIVRLKKRAGRPIKVYRSSADEYVIPFAVTPFAEIEERLRADIKRAQESIIKGVAKSIRNSSSEGRRILRSKHGDISYVAVDPEEPANKGEIDKFIERTRNYSGTIGETFSDELRLKDDDARNMLAELYELWKRYKDKSESEGISCKPYMLQAAVVEL